MPGRPTIYVVDDDEAVRDSMQALLESHEFGVEVFESVPAFLARRRAGNACLVLDAHLPGIGGLQLLERLSAENRNLPVILLTGRRDPGLAGRAANFGALALLEKPFDDNVLLDLIRKALQSTTNR